MRILVALFLLISTSLPAQTTDTTGQTTPNTSDTTVTMQQPGSNISPGKEEMDRNMDYILRLQKENRDKQRKAAMIRIALGVGFLVILVIGLMRRRKKQVK